PIALAHGDDRGEFVLVVRFPPTVGPLTQPLRLALRVYGRGPVPLPTDEEHYLPGAVDLAPSDPVARDRYLRERVVDPLWDLAVEPVPAPTASDYADVLAGAVVPAALERSDAPDDAYDLAVRGDRAPLDLAWVA
ncbi:MAG TPA: hypothetical protein VJ804_04685, partial [Acidimicrobiales bacterium]|nr:hypothetical protein [Acidimicrobiales bacterium]